jgi:hypothetical protein
MAAALFAVALFLLLIFILENSQSVSIGYFGAHGHLPLGVALLLAAVLGVLLVALPGTARILQLRVVCPPPSPHGGQQPGPSLGTSGNHCSPDDRAPDTTPPRPRQE